MRDITTNSWHDYELLDCGDGMKLERLGGHILSRPALQAIWHPNQPPQTWQQADAQFTREATGDGYWTSRSALPAEWTITWKTFTFLLKPTGFGHLGFFPEQLPLWEWVFKTVQAQSAPVSALNLFGYTGIMSLAAATAGAEVCHVDASKVAVEWARRNAALNRLAEAPIRWLVDDVIKFTERELRRKHVYHAIIMDPPSFGRGPKGQVWKLEQDLQILLDLCLQMLHPEPLFIILSCHTPGYSSPVLANMLAEIHRRHGGSLIHGNMLLSGPHCKPLPSGYYGLWFSSSAEIPSNSQQ